MNIRKLLPRRHTLSFPHWLPLRSAPKSERGSGFKQGQMTSNIIRWHPKQQNATTETREATETTQSKSSIYQGNDQNETAETSETTKTSKNIDRWKQAWLNYRMQGHSLPYYWITKAAIVICLVQQKVLTNIWMCWPWILYDRSASVLNYDVHMATDHDSKICAKKILKTKSLVKRALCIGQIEASTSPPGIPRAFDTLVVPVGREFDNQILRGGGEFWSPCTGRWGIWTEPSLDLISFWWFPFLVKAIWILWKNNLKKKKTDPFIYRFRKNGLYALGRSTTSHWEVAWNDERRQWT